MDVTSSDPTAAPRRAAGPAEVRRESGVVELRPTPLRVVGPGRRERGYRRRIADLEEDLAATGGESARLRRELEVARLVERGTDRFTDRLEGELAEVRGQGHRLMVALGALQRENAGLREGLVAARRRRLPERRPFWRRLLGR